MSSAKCQVILVHAFVRINDQTKDSFFCNLHNVFFILGKFIFYANKVTRLKMFLILFFIILLNHQLGLLMGEPNTKTTIRYIWYSRYNVNSSECYSVIRMTGFSTSFVLPATLQSPVWGHAFVLAVCRLLERRGHGITVHFHNPVDKYPELGPRSCMSPWLCYEWDPCLLCGRSKMCICNVLASPLRACLQG